MIHLTCNSMAAKRCVVVSVCLCRLGQTNSDRNERVLSAFTVKSTSLTRLLRTNDDDRPAPASQSHRPGLGYQPCNLHPQGQTVRAPVQKIGSKSSKSFGVSDTACHRSLRPNRWGVGGSSLHINLGRIQDVQYNFRVSPHFGLFSNVLSAPRRNDRAQSIV